MTGFLRAGSALGVVAFFAGAATWAAWPRLQEAVGFAGANPFSRKIAVELAADPQRGADWRLRPLDNQMKLRLGETGIAFFEAENRSDKPITVQAQYQVSPPAADKYIVRIACFCQDRQTLGPYQKADLPMTFFIDPAMAKDPAFASLKTITMSYKFQEAKTPDQQVAAIAAAEPMN